MKAKAKHWVNYNGVWHGAGDVFDIDPAYADEMRQYAEIIGDEPPVNDAEPAAEEPAKRGRKRKAEQ